MYYKQYRCNSPDFDKGNSSVWHEQYSIPHTVVFGKVTVRETLKILGMESAERHWGDVKQIKSGKRLHLSTEKMENYLMIYTKARLDKAKVYCGELEKLNDVCAA